MLVIGNCANLANKLVINKAQTVASFADTLTLSTTASFNQAQWPEHLHQILGQEFNQSFMMVIAVFTQISWQQPLAQLKLAVCWCYSCPLSLSHWLDPAISRWCSAEQQLSRSHFAPLANFVATTAPMAAKPATWLALTTTALPKSMWYRRTAASTKVQQRLSTNTAPILLSADRGRGKSALLGLLAAQLPQQSFILCSRHFHALKSCFSMLAQELGTPYAVQQKQLANLSYMAPDVLLQQHHNLDPNCIILVDEAAALPVPTLMAISQLGHRVFLPAL